MKKFLTSILLLAATWAQATLTQMQSFGGGMIPDGSPVGAAFTGNFDQSGFNSPVLAVSVGLEISGGYNANLYAYLVAPNGQMVVLLNRPGMTLSPFGNAGAGMNVSLVDGAANGSINTTLNPTLTGSYSAYASLSGLDGTTANGNWTLFFADLARGGGTSPSTLNGWSLDLTVVPEPMTLALVTFLAMLLALAGLRWAWRT